MPRRKSSNTPNKTGESAKTSRPTLEALESSGRIQALDAHRLRGIVERLALITKTTKELEAERGYTDYNSGKRYPGLVDELEEALILHDLTETGFRIPGYTVRMQPGSRTSINEHKLLAEGVPPEVIQRCKDVSVWLTAGVYRDRAPKEGTDDSEVPDGQG